MTKLQRVSRWALFLRHSVDLFASCSSVALFLGNFAVSSNNNNDSNNNASISIAQNKLSSAALTAVETSMSLVSRRRFAGKLFHTRGAATAKLSVPSAVPVLGTTSHLLSAYRRCHCNISYKVIRLLQCCR